MTVTTDPTVAAVLAAIAADQPLALDRLFQWLRFPSVSMDPLHKADCAAAAHWCANQLGELGFRATVRPSTGNLIVVGHRPSSDHAAPHILFYGHYDVQPVDPLDLWRHPPFEPHLETDALNGAMVVARGASDDKGQVLTFFQAVRGWIEATGDVPLSMTVLIEGDEESDSAHLDAFVRENAEELRATLALVCDSGAWDRLTPAITTSLRGFAGGELTISGPSRDLHSGKYGGTAINPIRALAQILGSLHDATGRVQIPGFYDGIGEPTPPTRERWQRLGFDPEQYLAEVGLKTPCGEHGRSVLELIWTRPTAEVNGIWGGYQGPGMKTVIPAEASAKISFRLVPGQDPARILANFEQFVRERLPPDCRATLKAYDGSGGLAIDPEAPFIASASRSLEAEWGRPPAIIGSGGSIPVVSIFKDLLGMDALMVGFSQDDDGAHSPNEKYNLESFSRGARSWAYIIAALANHRAV